MKRFAYYAALTAVTVAIMFITWPLVGGMVGIIAVGLSLVTDDIAWHTPMVGLLPWVIVFGAYFVPIHLFVRHQMRSDNQEQPSE